MNGNRAHAMRHAVHLACSGRCNNWWTVQTRLRIKGYKLADLAWTEAQRAWLNRLCGEARAARAADAQQPAG